MSRRSANWTAVDARDAGKVFVLTEPAATQSEAVALRLFLAAARSGVAIPDSIKDLGLVGLAIYGIELMGKVPYEEAKVAADFLMGCVKINEGKLVRELEESDIEEVATLLKLKKEVLTLITGFTFDVGRLTSAQQPTDPKTTASSTT